MRPPRLAFALLSALALAACSPQNSTPQAAPGAASSTASAVARAASGVAPGTPAAEAEIKAQLQAQAERWDRAIVAKDRAAIAGNMAEDFRQIDGEGHLEDIDSFVAGLMDPQLQIAPYTVQDFEVRLYGDVAVLSGRTHMSGSYGDKPFETDYRYIDLYVKREGQWKIVSVQITKLPTAPR
ncbi:nuclear transport factor 2 family protein [Pelomonas sp. APW6]|uniref:Nuclear transport factor 2 family protein n=1 Tax=Roseateles subflavus TaxID=3053353 RepID=A0ABT7LIY8_9BURK|nr:nuclear transport factor 2 family protein [Pelomonas sp. APW6]MDL5032409.1 nuclear transport factor 2 family protein [Pelomonas sp. APW6]